MKVIETMLTLQNRESPLQYQVMTSINTLDLSVVASLDEFKGLESEWNALVDVSAVKNVFLMHVWLYEWWKVYGEKKRLYVIVVRKQGELVGVLPLMFSIGTLGARQIQFMGSGEVTPNHLDLLAKPAERGSVLQVLVEHLYHIRTDWDVLELNKLVENSDFGFLLKKYFAERNLNVEIGVVARCSYIQLPSTYEGYLESRSRNKRRNIRKAVRDLERDFPGYKRSFVHSLDELDKVMSSLIEMHQHRWQAKGYPGAFATQQFRQFHHTVSARFLESGQLWVSYLEIDSRVVAVNYCFQIKDLIQGYLPGFEEELSFYSPGVIMKAFTIEQAINQGASLYDFLEGDESYKNEWTTGVRNNLILRVYASTVRGILAYVVDHLFKVISELGIKYLPLNIRRPLWQMFLRLRNMREQSGFDSEAEQVDRVVGER